MPESQAKYITPADVARHVGISPDTARAYLGEVFPKDAPKRAQHRFDAAKLPELVALCESKRKRRCFNRYNVPMSSCAD
jgi:hypothetical protein